MPLNIDEAKELKEHLEIELAATRVALKQAGRSIFTRWNRIRLSRKAREYEDALSNLERERQIEKDHLEDDLITRMSFLKKAQA